MSKRYSRNPDVVAGDVGGDEAVLLDVDAGKYFGLNPTASAVWNLLEEPHSLDELVTKLCERFDVDAETCSRDVAELVTGLCERKILLAADEA